MSIHIEKIILHQLIREDENSVNVILRDTELNNTASVNALISDINRIYNNKSKAYGLFNSDSLFAESVRKFRKGNQDFLNFTQHSAKQLRNELIKYPFAEGGNVIFCLYHYLATQYLLIAVLSHSQSALVNNKLDILTTNYLDIERADIIARLNLTEWQNTSHSKRYLTFLKGRSGRKVSDFFMDYLGASEGIDPKKQSKHLVQAIDDYCQELSLDKQEKQAYRNHVHNYCHQQLTAKEDINLKILSWALPANAANSFLHFIKKQPYQLDDQFPAYGAALKGLKKFIGSGGGLTINFDVALLGERIIWDEKTDTLTIKGIPPNLRSQLQRNFSKKQSCDD